MQRKTVARDGVGEPIETWGDVVTLWAQRSEGSKVAERFAANQTYAMVTTVFNVGFFPAFAEISVETHRLMYEGKPYDIHGAIELGRKRGVQLLCSARGEQNPNG